MALKPPGGSKGSSKTSNSKKGATSRPSSAVRKSKLFGARPKATQQKTKPGAQTASNPHKKKRKVYTDKELNLPTLNGIVPAGIMKPRGKKKGKIFVDDKESMMTILAMVNAEKEGQIESKMIKARQMEEIREARRKEAEARQERKREKLEGVKKELKRTTKKVKGQVARDKVVEDKDDGNKIVKKSKKVVSFA